MVEPLYVRRLYRRSCLYGCRLICEFGLHARLRALQQEIRQANVLRSDKTRLQSTLRRIVDGDRMRGVRSSMRMAQGLCTSLFPLSECRTGRGNRPVHVCTVVTKFDSYVEAGKFESWLFRIAMNRLRDEMRRRGRHAVPVAQEAFSGVAAPSDPGSSDFDQRELQHSLWDAIGGVPEADQQILHLRHVSEMSFKQIAEVLEQPLGTVLARHFCALKRLEERWARATVVSSSEEERGNRCNGATARLGVNDHG